MEGQCIVVTSVDPNEEKPQFELATFRLPDQLEAGQILVSLEAATLCTSDLHTMTGKRKEPLPAVLGHEGCGRVVASRRPQVDVGTRITFAVADICGRCRPCSIGPQQKCRRLLKYGHTRHDVSGNSVPRGCYSTHILLEAGTTVCSVDGIPPAIAAPANCSLATMSAACRTARQHLGTATGRKNGHQLSCLVVGGGMLGLYGAALMSHDGFDVSLVDVNKERMEFGRRFGAKPFMPQTSNGATQGQKDKFDVILEACGVANDLPAYIKQLEVGGVLGIVGCVTPNTHFTTTADAIVRGCFTLAGVHNYAPEDLEDSVKFLKENLGHFPFEELVSPPIHIQQFSEALALAKTRQYHRVLIQISQ